jgi:hypothetical protein
VAQQPASRSRFRSPRLPAGGPRRLTPAEAAALKARPWPRLPWWLWLAVVVTTLTMVVVALGLFGRAPAPLPVGARRSPPANDNSHGVGEARVPALLPQNRDRLVRRQAGCVRLAAVTLAGSAGEVDLLDAAAGKLCALRSTAPIERARSALQAAGAEIQFAEFELGINESTTAFGRRQPTVLVNGKFQLGGSVAERIAVLLVHEGSHVADGGPPTAATELAARRAELEACRRLFVGEVQPNRGCADAAALLDGGDATALRRLREAGYR